MPIRRTTAKIVKSILLTSHFLVFHNPNGEPDRHSVHDNDEYKHKADQQYRGTYNRSHNGIVCGHLGQEKQGRQKSSHWNIHEHTAFDGSIFVIARNLKYGIKGEQEQAANGCANHIKCPNTFTHCPQHKRLCDKRNHQGQCAQCKNKEIPACHHFAFLDG